MKKKKYLFCTNPLMYLTEIPPILLLIVCMIYNTGEGDGNLYPLIIFLILVIIFIFIYLFRYMTVSYEEIRCKGLFSSHDAAIINKDKTLILTIHPGMRLRVALFGNDGQPPMFDGLRGEPSIDIFLFRAKAFGGKRNVASLLRYFDVPAEDIKCALYDEQFSMEYELVSLEAEHKEDIREIRVKFKETI